MRIKALLTTLLLGSTLAGVASADPLVRDHREQPQMSYFQSRAQYIETRPSWMPAFQTNVANDQYGYQVYGEGAQVVAYNQGQDPYVEHIARGEWFPLARGMKLGLGRNTEATIDVGGRPLQSIELQSTSGRSVIDQVHVELTNGREIKLPLNRNLDSGSAPNLRVDLGPECNVGVRKIEIFGRSGSAGTFRVLGA